MIPQGKLRNEIAAILRRAERGERFTVTVAGRPVAELGPLPGGRGLAAPQSFAELIGKTPVDPGFAGDIQRMRAEDEAVTVDPWAP